MTDKHAHMPGMKELPKKPKQVTKPKEPQKTPTSGQQEKIAHRAPPSPTR